jgi:hypothetical protein
MSSIQSNSIGIEHQIESPQQQQQQPTLSSLQEQYIANLIGH